MFSSLLIANRGEIACRIIRTARRMGLRTIAVHSDADEDALHVRLADEAVRIGPAPAADSYLRVDAIVEAARRTGADAVHPGYGFLSERAILPRLCEASGLVFVGPSADIIETMGSKIGAKAVAERAGVPNVPGYAGPDQSARRLREEASRIGLPVMVKASAGGGGKGMRRVFEMSELDGALDLARREAEAAFGDPSLLLERLVLRPRHLEVQVAGDRYGHLVHLFERDCSVQRSNQKLIEEAPAPRLDPELRERLLAMGLAVAREVSYDNLGTVEFILEDGQSEPWFLEMNTRLQVEHTVTEAVTGFDLVEWQLRIAAGEPLPARQEDVTCTGAAIEARVTAERADHGFQPSAGPIRHYREPPGLRVDSGIAVGSQATPFYDSMLAKVVAHEETREAARFALEAGLRAYDIEGPATTLAFLADALAHPIFRDARATTSFIDEAFPGGWTPNAAHADAALCAAALHSAGIVAEPVTGPVSAWQSLRGFRTLAPSGGLARSFVSLARDDETGTASIVALTRLGERDWQIAAGQARHRVRYDPSPDGFRLRIADVTHSGRIRSVGDRIVVRIGDERHGFATGAAGSARGGRRQGDGARVLTAPMPGVVAQVHVAAGDPVEDGQTLLVLESMKLFVPVKAQAAGTVSKVACESGQSVAAGEVLVAFEAAVANEEGASRAEGRIG